MFGHMSGQDMICSDITAIGRNIQYSLAWTLVDISTPKCLGEMSDVIYRCCNIIGRFNSLFMFYSSVFSPYKASMLVLSN